MVRQGMEKTAIIGEVERLLGPSGSIPGILDRSGRVMMSGWDTVRPSPYYVLGINPGGEAIEPPPDNETIRASLRDQAEGWNFYLDEAEAPYRERFVSVMQGLNVDPRAVPVGNALFLRSSGVDTLPSDAQHAFACYCAPIHKFLLGIVRPRVVVLFGNRSWKFMTGRATPNNWNFNPDVDLQPAGISYRCGVLLLPHFVQGGPRAWSDNAAVLDRAVSDAAWHAKS
jgi:hypothetical protein